MLLASVIKAGAQKVAKAEQRLVVFLPNQIHDHRSVHSKGQQAFDDMANNHPIRLAAGQDAFDPAIVVLVDNELPRLL